MKQRLLLRISVGMFFVVSFSGLATSGIAAAATPAKTPAATSTSKTSTSTAKSTTPVGATNNSSTVQGFAADTALQIGTIVQLSGTGTAKVSAATLTKLDQIYGVTVDPHTLSITVSDSGIANESYVATTGTYNTLVSNQGGKIKIGDYITVSSVDGVGMEASPDQTIVLGRAVAAFDGKSNVIGNSTLKDTGGKVSQQVAIGTIPVAIDIRHNPNIKSTKAEVPKLLQRIGQAVAEKPVGAVRIYLSLFITGVSVIAAIVLLYSGVRNSLIAIGRNPLGKKSIFRGLLEIILTSLIVLIIGLFAVYLLLKL
jgi:hypothetical protein